MDPKTIANKKGVSTFSPQANDRINRCLKSLMEALTEEVNDQAVKLGEGNNPYWFITNLQSTVFTAVKSLIENQQSIIIEFTNKLNEDAEKMSNQRPGPAG